MTLTAAAGDHPVPFWTPSTRVALFHSGHTGRRPLCSIVELSQGEDMGSHIDAYTEAVRAALAAVPVSRREIARRGDFSHTTLNRIANGQQRADSHIAFDVWFALTGIAQECEQAAAPLRELRDSDPYLRRLREEEADNE